MKLAVELLPSHWACPLVNGDYSGCIDEDEKEIMSWLDAHPEYGDCVDVEDYGLGRFDGMICDLSRYTFPVVQRTSDTDNRMKA